MSNGCVISFVYILACFERLYRHVSPQIYAGDQKRFFKDFAAAYSKLLHLGCPKKPADDAGLFGWLFSLCR